MKNCLRSMVGFILCAVLCVLLGSACAYEDITPGSKGEEVKAMQTRLAELGYYFSNADGGYGQKSEAAVKRFQAGNGMEANGVATAAVLELLYAQDAVPASNAAYVNELNRKISVTAEEKVVYDGKTIGLAATVENLTDDAPAKTTLLWYSTNPAVATVNTAGVVTGKDAGTVAVYCYAKDDEQVCACVEIEVRTSAKAIALDQQTLTLLLGRSQENASAQLVCTVTPENAYNSSVTWTSSDETVATVNEYGMVQAVSMGKATITAAPCDESLQKTAVCVVTVSRSVDEVTLDIQHEQIYMGKTLQLTAQALPEEATDRKIVWTSSDPAVATVNTSGLVTGKTAGTVTVTASASDGSQACASCEVQVISAVKSLSLDPKTTELVLGSTEEAARVLLTLKTTPENAHYQTATWSSSDESVAVVDEKGMVQALKSGVATISAVTQDPASSASATATITVGDSVKTVSLSDTTLSVQKGKTATLTATVGPDGALNKNVVWSSANDNKVTVDAKGRITAKGVGQTKITATAADGSGVAASCIVNVYQPVTKITPKSSREVIFARRSVTLQADVSPSDATDKTLTWSSSDKTIATVDANGKVEGKKAGTVTITAKAADGSGRSCTFRVIVEPASPITLESIGFGIYQPNLLGLTVTNECSTRAIADFDFDIELRSYSGDVINKGSFSLGSDVSIAQNATRTIKRTLYGVGYAYKVTITITGVSFRDGTYYYIPADLQDTWVFRR